MNLVAVVVALLLAFVGMVLLAPIYINLLQRLGYGKQIRAEGPTAHYGKAGTPTMGGVVFIIATVIAIGQGAPFWFDLLNKFMVIRSTVKPSRFSRRTVRRLAVTTTSRCCTSTIAAPATVTFDRSRRSRTSLTA